MPKLGQAIRVVLSPDLNAFLENYGDTSSSRLSRSIVVQDAGNALAVRGVGAARAEAERKKCEKKHPR